MEKYIEIIKDYVSLPKANFALMVNGEWGNGKTHFLQNLVFPELVKINKKPVYVSLNGLKTIEEVSKQIYFSSSFLSNEKVKAALDSKVTKYITQFAKSAINVASTLGYLSPTEHTVDYEELINLKYDEIVLCFDDLERCGIDLIEILGFINGFVEQDDVRTIIVGNESEIRDVNIDQNLELKMIATALSVQHMKQQGAEDSKSKQRDLNKQNNSMPDVKTQVEQSFNQKKQYNLIKEKLIGKTITFSPDASFIIEGMISDYKEGKQEYFNFLIEHKEKILFVFNKSKRKNLRIIRHFLSDFLKIYNVLIDGFIRNGNRHRLVLSYFIPALITSIEFKEGKITEKEVKEIPSSVLYSLYTKNASFYGSYVENMQDNTSYNISKSINIYLTTSHLNEAELLDESQKILDEWIKQEQISSPTTLQNLINNYFEMENEEFTESLKEVFTKVKNGDYNLSAYPSIFYHFEIFKSFEILPTSMSMANVIVGFEEGIEKVEPQSSDANQFLNRVYVQTKSEEYLKIESKVNSKIQEYNENDEEDKTQSIVDLLPLKPSEFINQYYSYTRKPTMKAVFHLVNVEELFGKFKMLRNSDLQDIRLMFQSIYDFANINEFYKTDYENIIKLINQFESDAGNVIFIRKLQYELFIKGLKEIAERLNN